MAIKSPLSFKLFSKFSSQVLGKLHVDGWTDSLSHLLSPLSPLFFHISSTFLPALSCPFFSAYFCSFLPFPPEPFTLIPCTILCLYLSRRECGRNAIFYTILYYTTYILKNMINLVLNLAAPRVRYKLMPQSQRQKRKKNFSAF